MGGTGTTLRSSGSRTGLLSPPAAGVVAYWVSMSRRGLLDDPGICFQKIQDGKESLLHLPPFSFFRLFSFFLFFQAFYFIIVSSIQYVGSTFALFTVPVFLGPPHTPPLLCCRRRFLRRATPPHGLSPSPPCRSSTPSVTVSFVFREHPVDILVG